jgi:ribokinase
VGSKVEEDLNVSARIVVLGDINQDFVMRAERMPRPGETLIGSDLQLVPGGKCANQAVTAARAGAEVTVIGRLGEDVFGRDLRRNLEREGINTRFITSDPETHTGSAFIALSPSGENSILCCMGANAAVTPEQVEGAADAITGADLLLVQLAVPLEAVLHAMEIARAAGTGVLFDPTPVRGELDAMWPHATVACPNETEAEVIIGEPATGLEEAARAAGWLRERGVEIAIIKLGARGGAGPRWRRRAPDPRIHRGRGGHNGRGGRLRGGARHAAGRGRVGQRGHRVRERRRRDGRGPLRRPAESAHPR